MTEGGANASSNGRAAEDVIYALLSQIAPTERQRCIGSGIYGTPLYVDFYLPTGRLIVESKWQSSSGTADEKLPYLAENIISVYPCRTLVVLSGEGFREGAIEWLKRRLRNTEHEAMNISQFMAWAFKARRSGGG